MISPSPTSQKPRATWTARAALALGLALVTSCYGTRKLSDPTLVIRTPGGSELGASTDYGVVFLGQTARSGYIEVSAWFGDGESVESSVVEPVGGGIYTAETEILLPTVPLTFLEPQAGDSLLVVGRTRTGQWKEYVTVRSDPRVLGLLIDVPPQLRGRPDQVGAGVYWIPDGDELQKRLVGLVSGYLRLVDEQEVREFLTVTGASELWRLVAHRRDHGKRKPWVYREDIL